MKSNQKQFLKIIPSVKPIDLKPLSSNKILRQRVPEVFVTDYPRKCLHLPRILDENENKLNAIKFPIYNEPTLPRWYSCDHHKDAIYPGLRKILWKIKKNFHTFHVVMLVNRKQKLDRITENITMVKIVKNIKNRLKMLCTLQTEYCQTVCTEKSLCN